MRLEINTFARKGDILNDEDQVMQKIDIGRGLSESDSVEDWLSSIETELERIGFQAQSKPQVTLPLTAESAIDRFVIQLSRRPERGL